MKRRDASNAENTGQASGFTILQMIITFAIIAIVTTLGVFGIVSARAQMRLSASARQFASYAEKARADSVRRHAMGVDRASLTLNDATTYSVVMDFDRNGVIDAWDTKNFSLESGVVFTSAVPTTITFDWRGRSITGEVTPVMALGTEAGADSVLITVTGSGDVTLASEIFQDAAIPNVNLGDVSGDLRPDPTPNPIATPTPDPNATPTPTPTPDPNATPTPTPDPNATPTATPTPTPCSNNGTNCRETPTPTPTPAPTPLPPATPTPTPIPTNGPCTLTASPTSLTIANHVTKSVTLTVNNSSGPTTISVTGNTNASHISVSLAPGQSQTVTTGSGSVQFKILVNGNNQGGYITFSATSPCSVSTSIRVN